MPLSNYTEDQILFIKDKLALKTPPSQIVAEFKSLYEGRTPAYEDILDIKKLFKTEIKEKAIKELNNPSAVPVAYSRVRLEIIQKAIELAWQYKGRGSYPVTDPNTGLTAYKEKMDIDQANLIKLLDLAQKEEFLAKKLILEKLARGITAQTPAIDNQGIPSVPIYSGYEDEEEMVLIDNPVSQD